MVMTNGSSNKPEVEAALYRVIVSGYYEREPFEWTKIVPEK